MRLRNIALRLYSPEDRPHSLLLFSCHLAERQCTLSVQSAISRKYLDNRGLKIHRVVVNKLKALRDKLRCLLNAKLNSVCLHRLIISLDFLEAIQDFVWHLGLCKFDGSVDSIITKDRKYPWNNLTVDSC